MEENILEFNELDKDVNVVLLLLKNKNFEDENIFNENICGLKMKQWVKNACKLASITEVEIDENADIILASKTVSLSDRKYTLILFADTPLLKRKTVLEIIDYAKKQNLSVLKFTRGYIFETEYLKQIDKLYMPKHQYFDEEDFMACINLKQFMLVKEILQNRIIDYHIKNGVVLKSPSTTEIDVNVNIGKNTIIEGNNVIKGKCIIDNKSHIKNGNYIENSVIKSGCEIAGSVIKNSFIEENCKINPFVVIENNSLLEMGAQIGSFSYISNSRIEVNEIISEYSKIKN